MKHQLLPQITRFFSASTIRILALAVLWTALLSLFALNYRLKRDSPPLVSADILKNPLALEPHITLAKQLWDNSRVEDAIHELVLADALLNETSNNLPTQNVLGSQTKSVDLVTIWKSGPEKIQRHYDFWNKLSISKTDYRDAHIIAGLLAYQLGNTQEALDHINKARELDPNHPTLRQLSL